jgi:DNA-binding NarL/FixJ family response regulator
MMADQHQAGQEESKGCADLQPIDGSPSIRKVERVQVLLVDDHAMVRQGLRSVLDGYSDLEVTGEAADGEQAVALAQRLRPDVVVMDINMPKMNGIQATALIKSRNPAILVIGLSVNASGENQEAMKKAGAAALLTKDAAVEQLYVTIQQAVARLLK